MQVLEKYFKDPRYLINDNVYIGSIYSDGEHLKNFGLAYNKIDNKKRAVVVFEVDLTKISKNMQHHWYSHLLENQNDYFPNSEFVNNLIEGEWVEYISIYQALLLEIHYINEMCKIILIPPLFNKEYSFDTNSKNTELFSYHIILFPTRENYFNFVLVLEKLTTGNINIDTFAKKASLISPINRNDEDEKPKGSISMLNEWFLLNCKMHPDFEKVVIKPLKDLLKLRQTPAHKLYSNTYDENIWNDQNELMFSIYSAIRNIRLILANHPKAKTIKIPDCLYDGTHIAEY
jgi:hypothetical protein